MYQKTIVFITSKYLNQMKTLLYALKFFSSCSNTLCNFQGETALLLQTASQRLSFIQFAWFQRTVRASNTHLFNPSNNVANSCLHYFVPTSSQITLLINITSCGKRIRVYQQPPDDKQSHLHFWNRSQMVSESIDSNDNNGYGTNIR